jgi:hypothetical protein
MIPNIGRGSLVNSVNATKKEQDFYRPGTAMIPILTKGISSYHAYISETVLVFN